MYRAPDSWLQWLAGLVDKTYDLLYRHAVLSASVTGKAMRNLAELPLVWLGQPDNHNSGDSRAEKE